MRIIAQAGWSFDCAQEKLGEGNVEDKGVIGYQEIWLSGRRTSGEQDIRELED